MKIHIHEDQIVQMHRHLEDAYPFEGCGFFFGSDSGAERTITRIMPVENISEDDHKRRFAISPRDYLAAERLADTEGLVLQGIYHSHPDHPAIPSEHDRKAAVPFFSYIIVSVQKGKHAATRSWTLDQDRQFIEEPIKHTFSKHAKHIS